MSRKLQPSIRPKEVRKQTELEITYTEGTFPDFCPAGFQYSFLSERLIFFVETPEQPVDISQPPG